jgi:hypothetical protein
MNEKLSTANLFTIRDSLFANYRERIVHTGMRTWNNVYADQFAYPPGRRGTGIGGGFHGRDITTHDSSNKTGADLFIAHELDVRSFDHSVGGIDHRHEALTLYHS